MFLVPDIDAAAMDVSGGSYNLFHNEFGMSAVDGVRVRPLCSGDRRARAGLAVGAGRPLLPVRPPRRRPGRKALDDRVAPAGIVFVLKTGIAWNQLPRELAGVSGVAC